MSWLKSFWESLFTPDHGERLNNFTPLSHQVLALARKEAERLKHNFIDTEHLLLGLVKLQRGVAFNVLANTGLSLYDLVDEIEKQIGIGFNEPASGQLEYSNHAKKVLALAAKERKTLNHTYLGTEHILLGLLRDGHSVAACVLKDLGVEIKTTRQDILKELDPNYLPSPERKAMSQNQKRPEREPIDISRRYDIYCLEGDHEIVYRNARFKGIKTLFKERDFDPFSDYMELEQAEGQTILVSRTSITRFCEHQPKARDDKAM